jgi:hypothetical protein
MRALDAHGGRADAAALAAAWTPLDPSVANAVASLVAFSVVSLEPTLYEAFTNSAPSPLPSAEAVGQPAEAADARPAEERPGRAVPVLSSLETAWPIGAAPPAAPLAWVGCHADRADAPQLPYFRGVGLGTAQCARLCDGYPFFAMQGPDGQCRCGVIALSPTRGSAADYRKVHDRECGKPCAGEAGLQPQRFCGGRSRNAIFRILAPPRPQSNMTSAAASVRGGSRAPPLVGAVPAPSTAAVSYIGCVTPPRSSYVLPYARGAGHTTTSCAAVCRQFSYFALTHYREWGECMCGDEFAADSNERGDRHVRASAACALWARERRAGVLAARWAAACTACAHARLRAPTVYALRPCWPMAA